jgi:cytoskeletal protein CcmA (bactofilin family)
VLAPGRVKGDLHTPSLQIEKGVIFEGRSFMEGIAAGAAHPAPTPILAKAAAKADVPVASKPDAPKPVK